MSINHNNVLSEFPFYNLDNQEFLRITGWVHHSYHTLTESKDLFQDTIASPEKESELRESSYNSYIQSKYYTVKQTGNSFYQANKYHGFSMMHFNIRSLPKNLTSLKPGSHLRHNDITERSRKPKHTSC